MSFYNVVMLELTPAFAHIMCEKLGLTDTARQVNYRELFRNSMEPGRVDEIRKATNGKFVLEMISLRKK